LVQPLPDRRIEIISDNASNRSVRLKSAALI